MAEIIWTEPALQELDSIAEYIALDNVVAASTLVEEVFEKKRSVWKTLRNPAEFRLSYPIQSTGTLSCLPVVFSTVRKGAMCSYSIL